MRTNGHMIEEQKIRALRLMQLEGPLFGRARIPHCPRLLWLEDEKQDQNASIARFRQWGYHVDLEQELAPALRRARAQDHDLYVVDLKMSDQDTLAGGSGITFVRELRALRPRAPFFLYSAYLHDPHWRAAIGETDGITGYFDKPLAVEPSDLVDAIKKCMRLASGLYRSKMSWCTVDREIAPWKYGDMKKMSTEDIVLAKEAVWSDHGKWLTGYMAKNSMAWVLIVGDEIVGSETWDGLPSRHALAECAAASNCVPLLYGNAPDVEEGNWAPMPSSPFRKEDCYPRVSLSLDGKRIHADLDTGTSMTHVGCPGTHEDLMLAGIQLGRHSKGPYKWYLHVAKMMVRDEAGRVGRAEVPIARVLNWAGTPFAAVRKGRQALAGRDVMLSIPMIMEMDSVKRVTRIVLEGGAGNDRMDGLRKNRSADS